MPSYQSLASDATAMIFIPFHIGFQFFISWSVSIDQPKSRLLIDPTFVETSPKRHRQPRQICNGQHRSQAHVPWVSNHSLALTPVSQPAKNPSGVLSHPVDNYNCGRLDPGSRSSTGCSLPAPPYFASPTTNLSFCAGSNVRSFSTYSASSCACAHHESGSNRLR